MTCKTMDTSRKHKLNVTTSPSMAVGDSPSDA